MVKKKNSSAKVNKTKKEMGISEAMNNAPEGILILTFILFVGSLMALSFSLWMLTAADEFVANKAAYAQAYQGLNISENTFINFGVFSLIFSLLFYFVGRGLIRLDNRARVILLILMLVVLVSSVYNLFTGVMFYTNVFLLIASGIVLWYITAKKTVSYFKN